MTHLQDILTKDLLTELQVNQNLSQRKIAKLLGCSKSTVRSCLLRYGLDTHSNGRLQFLQFAKEITEKYVHGFSSLAQLGEEYGLSHNTISKLLRACGVLIRKKTRMKPQIKIPQEEWKLAYIAGIVDGEGNVGYYQNKADKHFMPTVSIANTNKQVMDWVVTNIGGHIYTKLQKNPKWKTAYIWDLRRTVDVLLLLTAIEPYLIIKKEKAKEVIAICKEHILPTTIDDLSRLIQNA